MIRFAKDKPNPQPRFLLVNPGSKILLNQFFEIPLPESVTLIFTKFAS